MQTMRCGIPLLENRVAPRCTAADTLMVVNVTRGHVTSRQIVPTEIASPLDLLALLAQHRVDTLVCGGITRDTRNVLLTQVIDIVDNVACAAEEIAPALEDGVLRAGFGLSTRRTETGAGGGVTSGWSVEGPAARTASLAEHQPAGPVAIDCLRCQDQVCLRGGSCGVELAEEAPQPASGVQRIVDASMDLAEEDQRQLCRLAELVYFCLEMEYRRIGLAFCVDLTEPAGILDRVLRRFFEVVPVCCKVGGRRRGRAEEVALEPAWDGWRDSVACNPLGQAEVLNRRGTDLNVIVGLCMGVDSVFTTASRAPVTTLFVKDRSLANNPIGALYSEYYLRESLVSAEGRGVAADRLGRAGVDLAAADERRQTNRRGRSDHDHDSH